MRPVLAMRMRGFRETDHLFVILLLLEWIAAIVVALFVSPLTWAGGESQIHVHIWAAFYLGGAIVSFPVALALAFPSATMTRHVVAIGQMLMGASADPSQRWPDRDPLLIFGSWLSSPSTAIGP